MVKGIKLSTIQKNHLLTIVHPLLNNLYIFMVHYSLFFLFREEKPVRKNENTKKRKSLSLTTSEYSSGLEPLKKKKKKIDYE